MKNYRNVLKGILFCLVGLSLVVLQLDVFNVDANSSIKVMILIIGAGCAVWYLFQRKFFSAILGSAVLLEIALKDDVSFWWLAIAGVILAIGLSMIFPRKTGWGGIMNGFSYHESFGHHSGFSNKSWSTNDDECLNIDISFGGIENHIKVPNVKMVKVNAAFAGVTLFFEDTLIEKEIHVYLDSAFSGLTLHVPRNTAVISHLEGFAHIVSDNSKNFAEAIERTITLHGESAFGGVRIEYL